MEAERNLAVGVARRLEKKLLTRWRLTGPLDPHALVCPDHLGAAVSCDGGDRVERLRRQRPDDDRHARLDDAGLLARDLGQCRSEMLLVIQVNRRDRGDDRFSQLLEQYLRPDHGARAMVASVAGSSSAAAGDSMG